MDRRRFVLDLGTVLLINGIPASSRASQVANGAAEIGSDHGKRKKSMELGIMVQPGLDPARTFARVRDLGFSNCFLSLNKFLQSYSAQLAEHWSDLLQKNSLTVTAVEVVGPPPLKWDFIDGPSTIGLVPRQTREARMDAIKRTSDFARQLGVKYVQTHCGFIPENPKDSLYEEVVVAIRSVADYCAHNDQHLLMETGQETPITLLRTLKDVDRANLGVGLDTANLILYGKSNPVDALDVLGPYVGSVHAKDGNWPTDPRKLGREVLIGTGVVDFRRVIEKLHASGYNGAITIEREISGPRQFEDVKREKAYLEAILSQVLGH